MFFAGKYCHARGLVREVNEMFSLADRFPLKDDKLRRFKEASEVVANNKLFPQITSCPERCYFVGNLTCSAEIRDLLLYTHCFEYVNGTATFKDDHNSVKNNFTRKYLLNGKFLGFDLKYGKCEDN